MFQFDASDPDFQPATTQADTAPRNQTRVSRHDDAWISPGFAGVTTTATITSTVSKGRASGVTVMSAASVFKSTLAAPALPTLPTGQPPKSTGHRRRSSVVLQGQKALLFVDDEPVVDEEAVEDAGDDRSRVAKSAAAAATAKTTAATTNGTGATLTVANADGDRKSRSKSRKKRDRKKKQKEMSKSPAPPQLARAATPSGQRAPGTPLQRPTRIAEESPALTPRRVETLKAEEKVPTLDLKGNGTATPSSPIFIKRGISPARSNVSSLSTSLQSQSMAAQIPQLTLNTKLGADQLVSKLSLHKCDSNSSDGVPDDAYEVPLEHDFVSSHANKKSPTGSGYGSDIDGSSGGSNSIMISRASSMVAQKRKMCAEDFEPLTMLGKGTYGTVILVRHKATGRLYAQKQLKKASLIVHKRMIEQTKTERNILESVRHPFVVKLFYAFQDHKKLYLILEYAQGGELFNYLATERIFPEDTASFYLAEIVLALDHLHRNVGVVYRDLKPENCLLDAQGHLLLTDFGLSKVAEDGARCKSLLGTPEYMAPEVLEGKTYGFEVDWWSLGALAFDLLTGSPPYPGNNNMAILNKINKTKLKLPFYLSPDSKDILTRLLRKDPSKRLGYKMPQDLQTIKKHRFFRKIDWVKLEKRELEPPIRPLITDPEKAENFATEFTEAGFSPVVTRGNWWGVNGAGARAEEDLHFGGFSFEGDAGSWGARAGYFKDFDGGCEEGNSS